MKSTFIRIKLPKRFTKHPRRRRSSSFRVRSFAQSRLAAEVPGEAEANRSVVRSTFAPPAAARATTIDADERRRRRTGVDDTDARGDDGRRIGAPRERRTRASVPNTHGRGRVTKNDRRGVHRRVRRALAAVTVGGWGEGSTLATMTRAARLGEMPATLGRRRVGRNLLTQGETRARAGKEGSRRR